MASTVDQHLQSYKPEQTRNDQPFHHFVRLPQELRLYIWEISLPCERLLGVRLVLNDSQPRGDAVNAGEGSSACNEDKIIVSGRKVVPKLLNICKESRSAALKFYRVQLPCDYESNNTRGNSGKATGTGTFYFNPEFDIIKIRSSRRKRSFVDFVLALRSHDSKNVGLLNLAMDINDLGCDALRDAPLDGLDPAPRDDFTQTLSALKQVFFMSIEGAGRMYLGPLHGIPGMNDWEMLRSMPIKGSVPRFQRIKSDPRKIEEDLKKVYLGTFEPRKMIVRWRKILKKYSVNTQPGVQYRFLLACEPRPKETEIIDQKSAAEYILHEDKTFQDGVERWEKRLKNKKIPRETPEFLQTVPKTAIGFWLFPIQALGGLPPENLSLEESEQHISRSKSVVDMTDFRPELGLLDLS